MYTRRELLMHSITGTIALAAGCATIPIPKTPRRYNLGTDLLIFEKLAGISFSEDYFSALQSIINEATVKVRNNTEPKHILKTIDDLLHGHFQFNEAVQKNPGLLSELFPKQKKMLTSHLASYLYLTIAEEQKLPLRGVLAPDYFFIRWYTEKGYFNWDAQQGITISNAEYIQKLAIPEMAVENGTYLRSLSRREINGIHLVTIAGQETGAIDRQKRLEYFTKGIGLNVRHPRGLNNAGLFWMNCGSYAEALPYFNTALLYDPSFEEAKQNQELCLKLMKDNKKTK